MGWLERAYREDTVQSLELLCIANDGHPEIEEMAALLCRLHMLVAVHRCRLLGATIEQRGRVYILDMAADSRDVIDG